MNARLNALLTVASSGCAVNVIAVQCANAGNVEPSGSLRRYARKTRRADRNIRRNTFEQTTFTCSLCPNGHCRDASGPSAIVTQSIAHDVADDRAVTDDVSDDGTLTDDVGFGKARRACRISISITVAVRSAASHSI